MAAFLARVAQRYPTALRVLANMETASRKAVIVDISTHGAKVSMHDPYAQGDSIVLELDGEQLRSTVTWAEIDRIGVKFQTPIAGGAFRVALEAAMRRHNFLSTATLPGQSERRAFGRRAA